MTDRNCPICKSGVWREMPTHAASKCDSCGEVIPYGFLNEPDAEIIRMFGPDKPVFHHELPVLPPDAPIWLRRKAGYAD